MGIIVTIIAALFVLSHADAKLWPQKAQRNKQKKAHRRTPILSRRSQRATPPRYPLWCMDGPRRHAATRARWWWE